MDKKLTTTLGIALGASLLAGAGFGIYKYFSSKRGASTEDKLTDSTKNRADNRFIDGFIGNSLVKSNSLYRADKITDELVGGGLYNA